MTAKRAVVFAVQDIPEGTLIKPEDLKEGELPSERVPPDALSSVKLVRGQFARYGISAGQIVSEHNLVQDYIKVRLVKGYGIKLLDIANKKGMSPEQLAADWLKKNIDEETSK
jgi:flagella basal body P-ring formation protein FlgA